MVNFSNLTGVWSYDINLGYKYVHFNFRLYLWCISWKSSHGCKWGPSDRGHPFGL